MGGRSLFVLIAFLFSFPSWACYQIHHDGAFAKSAGYQLAAESDHNVGRFEYSPALDGWVIVDSWYDPNVDLITPQSGDFLWSSAVGDHSILMVPDTSTSGAGPTPSTDPNPPEIPQSEQDFSRSDPTHFFPSCSFEEPAKELDDISVIGISLSPMRTWLTNWGAVFALIRNGGGGSGAAEGTLGNPIDLGELDECDGLAEIREAQVSALFKQFTHACLRNVHLGRYYRVGFPNNQSGIYLGINECRASYTHSEVQAPSC